MLKIKDEWCHYFTGAIQDWIDPVEMLLPILVQPRLGSIRQDGVPKPGMTESQRMIIVKPQLLGQVME